MSYIKTLMSTDFINMQNSNIIAHHINELGRGIDRIKALDSALVSMNVGTVMDYRSISKIRILSENKVVEVTFADGQKVKTICDDESEFSLEFALYLSLAKRLYSDKYTSEGVWKKAQDLKYEKYFVKLVQDGLKMYKKEQKENEEAEKRAEEERQIIERKKAKKIAYKKRREERRKADQVDAIVQAMKIANETK